MGKDIIEMQPQMEAIFYKYNKNGHKKQKLFMFQY